MPFGSRRWPLPAFVVLAVLLLGTPPVFAESLAPTAGPSITLATGYGIDHAHDSAAGFVHSPYGLPGWYAVQYRPTPRSSFELGYQHTRGALGRRSTAGVFDPAPHTHHVGLGYGHLLPLGRSACASLGGSLRWAPIRHMIFEGRHQGEYRRVLQRHDLLVHVELELGRRVPRFFLRGQAGPTLIIGPDSWRRLFEDRLRNGYTLNLVMGARFHVPLSTGHAGP